MNTLTDDIVSNIINDTYKFTITRDTILNSLNDRVDSLNSSICFFIILLSSILILWFFVIKKKNHLITIIAITFCFCYLGINIYECIRDKNNILYSIENNCWSIENDVVIDKYTKGITLNEFGYAEESSDRYCLKLNQYGELTVSLLKYQILKKYDDVYVICVQDKSGKKSAITNQIWPYKETLFLESVPLP